MPVSLSGSARIELADGRLVPVSSLVSMPLPTRLRGAHILSVKRLSCSHVFVIRLQYGAVQVRLAGTTGTRVSRVVAGALESVPVSRVRVGDLLLAKGRTRARVLSVCKSPAKYRYSVNVYPKGAALVVDGVLFTW